MAIDKNTEKMTCFIRFFSNYINTIEKEMSKSDFNFNEIRILFDILENEDVTAREIEDNLDLDKGYTSRILKKLIDEDIIIKSQSDEDKRLYHLALTKKGEKVGNELYDEYLGIVHNDLNALTKEQQKKLIESLMTIEEVYQQI